MAELDWQDGFKVLVEDKGKYYSCSLNIDTRQQYRIGKPTKRREGKWGALAVFKSLISARAFEESQMLSTRLCIFSCKWLPSPSDVKGIYMPAAWHSRHLKKGYSLNPNERRTTDGRIMLKSARIPSGTQFAEEVIILERA